SDRADARRRRAVRTPRPRPRTGLATATGMVARAPRGEGVAAGRRHGGGATAAALGRSPARSQLHGRRGDVPAPAARRPGLFPSRAAPAAGPAPARPGAQRPGQGSQLAGAGRRYPRHHRFPARGPRSSALALDAPARARGPAPPAQAQADVLPAVDHPGGAARAEAALLVARRLVRHRQAGLPVRDPAAAQVGRQRRPGPQALTPTMAGNPLEHAMATLSGKTLFITGASRGIG